MQADYYICCLEQSVKEKYINILKNLFLVITNLLFSRVKA